MICALDAKVEKILAVINKTEDFYTKIFEPITQSNITYDDNKSIYLFDFKIKEYLKRRKLPNLSDSELISLIENSNGYKKYIKIMEANLSFYKKNKIEMDDRNVKSSLTIILDKTRHDKKSLDIYYCRLLLGFYRYEKLKNKADVTTIFNKLLVTIAPAELNSWFIDDKDAFARIYFNILDRIKRISYTDVSIYALAEFLIESKFIGLLTQKSSRFEAQIKDLKGNKDKLDALVEKIAGVPSKVKASKTIKEEAKPKVEVKPVIQSKPKIEVKPVLQPKPKIEVKPTVQPQSKVEAKPKAQPMPKVEVKENIPLTQFEKDKDQLLKSIAKGTNKKPNTKFNNLLEEIAAIIGEAESNFQ